MRPVWTHREREGPSHVRVQNEDVPAGAQYLQERGVKGKGVKPT